MIRLKLYIVLLRMYALPVSLKLIDIIARSETSDYQHLCEYRNPI